MNYKTAFAFSFISIAIFISCNKTSKELTKNPTPKIESKSSVHLPKAESYDKFYKKFHSDSLFQLSRVKFPISGYYIDTNEISQSWTRDNWIMHKNEIQNIDTSQYKVELKNQEKFKTELLFIEGGGFRVERKFKLINGKWYLVYFSDENF